LLLTEWDQYLSPDPKFGGIVGARRIRHGGNALDPVARPAAGLTYRVPAVVSPPEPANLGTGRRALSYYSPLCGRDLCHDRSFRG
jgi:hypothetical protein